MRISKLSKYTFKVMLTPDDILKLGADIELIDNKGYAAKKFISQIIDIIERSMKVKISKSKLFVEVFEEPMGGCVVYLCGNEELITDSRQNEIEDKTAVFSLDFKQLLSFAKSAKKLHLDKAESSLYFNNGYRIILRQHKKADDAFAFGRLLSKYHGSYNKIDILSTEEHFTLLCKNNAIDKILGTDVST